MKKISKKETECFGDESLSYLEYREAFTMQIEKEKGGKADTDIKVKVHGSRKSAVGLESCFYQSI